MTVWNIRISAPTGDFGAKLEIDGDTVVMSGENGSSPVTDLKASDNAMSWSTKIDKPMPMTLKFKGDIDGDAMSGKVKFGVFASGTFTGEKAS
ncbi:MAG: hypothetical protein AAGI10_02540 [Pseudomonadota bacterium]